MTYRKTDLPVYIYVEKIDDSKNHHFKGDFCEGRIPTKEERKIFQKYHVLNIDSSHFIATLRNTQNSHKIFGKDNKYDEEFCFPTLEALISRAIDVYKQEAYKGGLILGYDGKNPPPDKVLIVGDGSYNTIDDFLIEAQKNNLWVKMLQ
jgi:hypothetical protein